MGRDGQRWAEMATDGERWGEMGRDGDGLARVERSLPEGRQAAALVGERDFRAFANKPRGSAPPYEAS